MTLITTNTSTNAASSSFTSGIDSTYKLYIFKFYDCNPATDETNFQFQANAVGASGYGETITSTTFRVRHDEANSYAEMSYETALDQAQGTGFQSIAQNTGNGADESCVGELFLFNPSNTTYVKHFYARSNSYWKDQVSSELYIAGYFNTTTAIDDIQFKFASGNMDGVIKMYGVG